MAKTSHLQGNTGQRDSEVALCGNRLVAFDDLYLSCAVTTASTKPLYYKAKSSSGVARFPQRNFVGWDRRSTSGHATENKACGHFAGLFVLAPWQQ